MKQNDKQTLFNAFAMEAPLITLHGNFGQQSLLLTLLINQSKQIENTLPFEIVYFKL